MDKIISIILLVALGITSSCSDPFETDATPAYDQLPVVDILESQPERFSLWVDLLGHADLGATLNLDANYTCFVPENEAVLMYLSDMNLSSVTDLPVEVAKHLVKYHTIAGTKYTQSSFSNGVIPDSTASGDFLSIELRDGGLDFIYVNDEARITQLDISATNGVIHSMERVLTPVVETIWDKVNNDRYSIFREAVLLTGYNESLNEINYVDVNAETGESQIKRRFYTCFAVTDETYNNEDIQDLNQLIERVSAIGEDYESEDNLLNKYVAYHLLDQQLDFTSLSTFSDDNTSKNIATLAVNELINLSQRNDYLVINYLDGEENIVITAANLNARNGVLHEVSATMLVQSPPVTTVIWELTDYSGLSALFPSNYRRSGLTSTFRGNVEVGDVTCYEWQAIPADRNNSAVVYYVANKNDGVPYGLSNYDCLVFSGGLFGWIEMESPAIVKGTYTMKVQYYSINSASKYGRFMTILDGAYVGSEIATHGSSSTTAKLVTTTIGKVTFEETKSHMVRLLASDDSALYIDYIEFVPEN